MTSVSDLDQSYGPPAAAAAARASLAARLTRRPVAVFIVLSVLVGIPAIFLIPPLRGADEPAHFLRAYGILRGEVIPALADQQGRKGIFLPARLHDDYEFFETVRYRFATPGFSYRDVFAEYFRRKSGAPAAERPPVFVLYAGSEGYAPVAYLPFVAAAALADAAGLDFVPMLLLMRLVGLVLTTALAAYAIAIVPHLRWTFVLIAMLPIALFERAIVCADGAALSLAMVVTAMCVRAAAAGPAPYPGGSVWQRSLWMTLCVLVKPSQVALVVLEGMTRPFKHLLRDWRITAAVVAPGLILTPLWLFAVSADMAAWRMIEGTGEPAQHFEIGWKLRFLVAHPQHFLSAALGSLGNVYDLWREAIGGLGWRDTHLSLGVYVVLSVMLLAAGLVRLEFTPPLRRRVAAIAVLTVLGYWAAIFLIFYLAWTPIETQWIHGIQGRYFTIILPPAALAFAVLVNRALPATVTAWIAITGAALSGAAMLDAVVRSQW